MIDQAKKAAWVRILPFAVFMGFIGLEQGLRWWSETAGLKLTDEQLLWIYPIKALLVAGLLLLFWRRYDELTWKDLTNLRVSLASILVGLLVFALWIQMDWPFASFGESSGYNPYQTSAELVDPLIAMRLFGAVLVVPVMEELFWRSFLLRYIINPDFRAVRLGTYTLGSFAISALLFGLEHHLVLAGIMAGIAYNLLLYKTRSIPQCVLAHAVTNLALGVYVLQTGNWQFW